MTDRLDALREQLVPNDSGSYKLRPDHEPWMMEMAMSCHDNEWPNDWRWSIIHGMAESWRPDDPDWAYEFADDQTDTYNSDLLRWLNDAMSRAGYTERAVYDDCWDALRNAQYLCILSMTHIFDHYMNERG